MRTNANLNFKLSKYSFVSFLKGSKSSYSRTFSRQIDCNVHYRHGQFDRSAPSNHRNALRWNGVVLDGGIIGHHCSIGTQFDLYVATQLLMNARMAGVYIDVKKKLLYDAELFKVAKSLLIRRLRSLGVYAAS